MSRCAAIALLCLAGIGACGPADRSARARAELLAADRAFDSVTAARGVDGWVAFFDDSGAMFPNGVPVTRGPEAIRTLMTPVFADTTYHLRWAPVAARAGASGDLGYTEGRFTVTSIGPDGRPDVRHGRYISIWRRQADGSWKVLVDIGNQGPPAAEPAP